MHLKNDGCRYELRMMILFDLMCRRPFMPPHNRVNWLYIFLKKEAGEQVII
jgi:hypothetical protein